MDGNKDRSGCNFCKLALSPLSSKPGNVRAPETCACRKQRSDALASESLGRSWMLPLLLASLFAGMDRMGGFLRFRDRPVESWPHLRRLGSGELE